MQFTKGKTHNQKKGNNINTHMYAGRRSCCELWSIRRCKNCFRIGFRSILVVYIYNRLAIRLYISNGTTALNIRSIVAVGGSMAYFILLFGCWIDGSYVWCSRVVFNAYETYYHIGVYCVSGFICLNDQMLSIA